MTNSAATRRAALMMAVGAVTTFALAPAALATRDTAAEAYVQENAMSALRTLGNPNLSADARQREFSALMRRFANVPSIASFVLGRYARQMRADQALWDRWLTAFTSYSIAVYEDQLDQYRGNSIRVTGSIERRPGRDVIVQTEMSRPGGRALPVQWRITRSSESNPWRVVDVSLVLDGNEVWLAQQQQRDFLAQLDSTNGNLPALVRSVEQTTASLRQRINARLG
jgi:phospholipid transport system substrate-binding protein